MQAPANFVELLRAAVAMGETHNLSQAAKREGMSRPTIRRHLQALDEHFCEKLFELRGQSYFATPFGDRVLPVARKFLGECDRFLSPDFSNFSGLRQAAIKIGDGWFHTRQSKLNDIWRSGPETFRECLTEWTLAKGDIEAPQLQDRRRQLVVLRQDRGRWVCVEIGEDSAMAKWLGWEATKSAVGRPIEQSAMSNEANQLLLEPLDYVTVFGGAWYDFVSARFPRPSGGLADPVSYYRLVLSCSFPDGSPAVVTFVELAEDIDAPDAISAAA